MLRKQNVFWLPKDQLIQVRLHCYDGKQRDPTPKQNNYPLNLHINRYTENISFTVCPLNHDVILGMNWNNEHKAKIDLETDKVELEYRKNLYSIDATQGEQVFNYSAKHPWSRVPKWTFIVCNFIEISRQPKPRNHKYISQKPYFKIQRGIPPNERSKDLPRERQVQFRIDLHSNATPQR